MDITDKPIINRVAKSGLETINLETYFPAQAVALFDLKAYLYMELILKEKDFRAALKEHDWTQYTDKHLLVFCSSDAIIPVWAYMLVAVYANEHAASIFQGTEKAFYEHHYNQVIGNMDVSSYTDKRIVIKGCSKKPVPPAAYLALTAKLQPIAKSIMYGEPCSTVPIYKKKK